MEKYQTPANCWKAARWTATTAGLRPSLAKLELDPTGMSCLELSQSSSLLRRVSRQSTGKVLASPWVEHHTVASSKWKLKLSRLCPWNTWRTRQQSCYQSPRLLLHTVLRVVYATASVSCHCLPRSWCARNCYVWLYKIHAWPSACPPKLACPHQFVCA